MTSVIALNGVTSFWRWKDDTQHALLNSCETVRFFGGMSSVQLRKVRRRWSLQIWFCSFLCVRSEIDQLKHVNCWVIIHCWSVSCEFVILQLLYNWPPNSELLLNNSLLELIYFLNNIISQYYAWCLKGDWAVSIHNGKSHGEIIYPILNEDWSNNRSV